ncbi:hypothetical protein NM680_10005 [Paracoccus sp. PS-1]|uniref:hypothetical protein n=1 Tax=Paracoccus sp. PS1 TaxID=2963938 RepID=UPI0027E5A432|nr:hypothetical protein [Paracoccus sp. PS1]MDQ7262127.1 hypothetical protein [Paracoccus sp. PS1]
MTEDNQCLSTSYAVPGQKGFQKGNPGRPKGSKNRFAVSTLKELATLKGDAMQVLRDRLAAGDLDAAKFIIEKIVGKNSRLIELSGTDPESIANDIADGSLNVEEAAKLSLALQRLSSIEKIEELEKRLDELNALLKDSSV